MKRFRDRLYYFFSRRQKVVTGYSGAQRKAMLRTYYRLFWKRYLLVGLMHRSMRKESFLGFEFSFFDYKAFYFLFDEIFIDRPYAVDLGRADPFIIDCGANIGMSILFFKWLWPGCSIVAFEPSPPAYALLERNIAQNAFDRVELHNAAVYYENTTVDFHYNPENPGSLTASILPSMIDGLSKEIPGVVVSDFIRDRTDLIKLDIEGIAVGVLQQIADSGSIGLVNNFVVEFERFQRMPDRGISKGLAVWEAHGFDYQLTSPSNSAMDEDQIIHAHAFRADGQVHAATPGSATV